jgi:thioredoxin 1
MASDKVLHLTDDTFEQTIQEGTPVLIDFWAEWCGPCRRMTPIIDELAVEYDGKAKIAKLDIDQHQKAATKLGIMSIPTILIYKGGSLAETIVGAVPKSQVVEALNRVV